MISFEKIDKYSLRYAFLFYYVRFVHRYIYNSDYRVLGGENIPPKGTPTLVISNHQNGLLDALGIIFAFRDGRQPVFIARADIFNNPIAAKLLRFLKIMPAFRIIDVARNEVSKSNVTFLRAARVLMEGGTVAIFPEAGHEETHHLGTFKKGFPRIAFKAEEEANFNLNLQILPVANHYSNYVNFRQKKVMVIGKPFGFSEFFDTYKSKPNDAYIALNEKCRAVVKEMMLDVEDLTNYDSYRTISEIIRPTYFKHLGKKNSYFPNHLFADKEITAHLDSYRENSPEDFTELMKKTSEYNELTKELRLRDWLIGEKTTFGKALLTTLCFLITFPIYLFGLIHNFIPFFAPNIFTKKIKDHMLHSSFNMVVGALFSFPLFYLLYFVVFCIVSGNFLYSLVYLLAVLGSLLFFYYYRVGVIKLVAAWRYLRYIRKGDSRIKRLLELREDIKTVIQKLLFDK